MRAYYLYANYCGACHVARENVIDPLIAQGFSIKPVNCMREPDVAQRFNVSKIPLVVVVGDDGQERHRLLRSEITREAIKDALEG